MVFGTSAFTDEKVAARESARKFVRGKTELGVLREGSNPAGHIMTAWEAYQSYGFEVLDEAVEYGSAILLDSVGGIERSLSSRREELGLSMASVARAAQVGAGVVKQSEIGARDIPVQILERMCLALGLDERLLAFDKTAGADRGLAFRLKTLRQGGMGDLGISEGTVLAFTEAASIIRIQSMLMGWLGYSGAVGDFPRLEGYGASQNADWGIGDQLAAEARDRLGLGQFPIYSMRRLVEDELNIPVVQARLRNSIAGATIETQGSGGEKVCGFVLNTVGENTNVGVRRATLAYALGHLLCGFGQELNQVRVDSYDVIRAAPDVGGGGDSGEQRANAFATAFLAPPDLVREMTPPPVGVEAIREVMGTFGISYTAARRHVSNVYSHEFAMPEQSREASPPEVWVDREGFIGGEFPIASTPLLRRGRFAGLVAEGYQEGLLSSQTAALYLGCGEREFLDNADSIRGIWVGQGSLSPHPEPSS